MKRNSLPIVVGTIAAVGIAKLFYNTAYKRGSKDAWYDSMKIITTAVLEDQIKKDKEYENQDKRKVKTIDN